jgi:hypothetical protein
VRATARIVVALDARAVTVKNNGEPFKLCALARTQRSPLSFPNVILVEAKPPFAVNTTFWES